LRPDCYALYVDDLDLSADKLEEDLVLSTLHKMQKKFSPAASDLLHMLKVQGYEA
jgi:hypothetical protein